MKRNKLCKIDFPVNATDRRQIIMRIAIVGSRNVPSNIEELILAYLPRHTSEIVSGSADGVDTAAAAVARQLSIPLRVFVPDYAAHGKAAPLVRNEQIIAYANEVLAFWDRESPGTRHVIATCIKTGKPIRIIPIWKDSRSLSEEKTHPTHTEKIAR